ncbi:hypothetical protein ACFXGA_18640 [Actinosynnema sp. NPDC059335]|uniref:hypothetical protein n=1 Tax=Actinosynnema sp. NPDC059335 TaxID=3346804 RepID=UPI00366BF9B4
MDTVDYFDAWARWAAGDVTLREDRLWGLQVLWWARIGKIFGLVAGLSLIIDIIGPEKFLRRAERAAGMNVDAAIILLLTLPGAAFGAVILANNAFTAGFLKSSNPNAIWMFLGVAAFNGIFAIFFALAIFNDHRHIVSAARFSALTMLLVGFHFDMLGS